MKRILRFRAADKRIFNDIKSGRKKVETRAATIKYRSIKMGDIIVFSCGSQKFSRKVKFARHFKTTKALLGRYGFKLIRPDLKSKQEVAKSYDSFPGYKEKIKRFGIMAFEV